MTTEEKQLLLQVISANLTHGLKAFFVDVDTGMPTQCKILGVKTNELVEIIRIDTNGKEFGRSEWMDVSFFNPYLRPISSMTEEEKTWATASYEYNKLTHGMDYAITAYVDYLYSIHIDCHDLIPKGLAIPAPEGKYDLK